MNGILRGQRTVAVSCSIQRNSRLPAPTKSLQTVRLAPNRFSSEEAFVPTPPGTAQWCLCESDVEVPKWRCNFERGARPLSSVPAWNPSSRLMADGGLCRVRRAWNRCTAVPGRESRIQISNGPGAQPRWRRDGAALIYISPDGKLMTVDFDSRTGKAGRPHALLETQIVDVSLRGFQYDVAPDGRFLINSLPKGPSLTLVAGCLPR